MSETLRRQDPGPFIGPTLDPRSPSEQAPDGRTEVDRESATAPTQAFRSVAYIVETLGHELEKSSFSRLPEDDRFLEPARQDDELGRLGRYRVLRRLGKGGMGIVFLAEDSRLGRRVALKVMDPRHVLDEVARRRFVREARATAALNHRNIVTIYHVDQVGEIPFLVMELLEGESIDGRLRRGHLPSIREVLRIGREIASGLAAAHDAGMVHRDIKPANLWLEAPEARVKILDFGLARPAITNLGLTQSGAIMGTPYYMSPEQARSGPIDARSDLFSLGCILHQLASGQLPFTGSTLTAILLSLALDHPQPLHEVASDVPPTLSDLVLALLAKAPSDRPGSAREVVEAIEGIERSCSSNEPPSPAPRPAIPILTEIPDLGITIESEPIVPPVKPRKTVPIESRRGRALTRSWLTLGMTALAILAGSALLLRAARVSSWPGAGSEDIRASTRTNPDPSSVRPTPPAAVDDVWLRAVAASPPEAGQRAIVAKFCDLNPGLRPGDIRFQREGKSVASLSIRSVWLKDLSPLLALDSLSALQCGGLPNQSCELSDLGPLRRLNLEWLEIAHADVRDLAPLKGLPLKALRIVACPVDDLGPLLGMPLETLNLLETQATDFRPLQKLPLKVLVLKPIRPRDLGPLRQIPTLETINGRALRDWPEPRG